MEKKKIQVLIIDDNTDICDILSEYFLMSDDIGVAAIAHDGIEAYRLFKELQPDVVLLDMIMPLMDGFGFLEQVREDRRLHQSKIMIVSAIGQENIAKEALQSGADYYVVKPFDLKNLANRIRKLMLGDQGVSTKKPVEERSSDIHSIISTHLMKSGLPIHTLGYKYMQSALLYLIQTQQDIFSITKLIYPYIAEKYETSSSCVDKAMRHALTLAKQNSTEQFKEFLISLHYRNSDFKPSNGEYLNMLLERIKQDLSRMK